MPIKMCHMQIVFVICILAISVQTSVDASDAGEVPSSASERLKYRLLNEAPQSWAEWRDLMQASPYHVERHVQIEEGQAGARDDTQTNQWSVIGGESTSFWRGGNLRLALLRSPATDTNEGSISAWGENESYYFHLKRIGGERWMVRQLKRSDGSPLEMADVFPSDVPWQYMQFSIEGVNIGELIKASSFEIISINLVDNERYVKLTFLANEGPDEYSIVTGGAIWFLPNKFWLVDRYAVDISSQTKGMARKKFAYEEFNGLPVLERATLNYKFDGDPPLRYTFEYDWESGPFPDELFTLSHFGLPEPNLGFDSTELWGAKWIWINFAVLILIAIAYATYRGTKRKSN